VPSPATSQLTPVIDGVEGTYAKLALARRQSWSNCSNSQLLPPPVDAPHKDGAPPSRAPNLPAKQDATINQPPPLGIELSEIAVTQYFIGIDLGTTNSGAAYAESVYATPSRTPNATSNRFRSSHQPWRVR